MLNSQSDPCLAETFKLFSRFAIVASWIFSLALLLGPRISAFNAYFGTVTVIRPVSLIVFILAGASLWMSTSLTHGKLRQTAAWIMGLPITILGAWNLWQSLSAYFLHLNTLQMRQFEFETALGYSVYAVAFLFLGISVLLLPAATSSHANLAQAAALIPAVISLLGICDHIIDPNVSDFQVPVVSAILFGLLSFAVLMSHPETSLLSPLSSDSSGGELARRLMPVAVLVSMLAAWLRYQGEERGLYSSETGVGIFAVLTIMVLAIVIWWSCRSLGRADVARRIADETARWDAEQLLIKNIELTERVEQLESRSTVR